MTPTEQDLARRLAAHPQWPEAMRRHGLGMVVSHRRHESQVIITRLWDDDHAAIIDADGYVNAAVEFAACLPVLDQPATQGCLLAMLSDDLDYIAPAPPGGRWHVELLTSHGPGTCPTLGEALARAVLAAWGEA